MNKPADGDERTPRGSTFPAPVEAAPPMPDPEGDVVDDQAIARRTRRSFLGAAAAAGAGYGAWHWLQTRRSDQGVPWPLRRVLETNEQLARDHLLSTQRAPEYPYGSAPPNPRVNGDLGLTDAIDVAAWRLRVSGIAAAGGTAELTLDQVKALPRAAVAMRLCCIEGWSVMVNWAGARFADFAKAYPPLTRSGNPADLAKPDDLYDYVSMETPDGSYYVGLDVASVLHPQTLLCYEIDGKPLTAEHGAPLRLVIPTKYGVKNIKRIGHIRYTGVRPADYWAQRGYDWYAGL